MSECQWLWQCRGCFRFAIKWLQPLARRKSVAEGRFQCHRCSRRVYSRQCGRAAVHTVLEGSTHCGERRAKVARRLTTLPLQRTTSSPTSWFGEPLLNTVRRSGARTYSPTPRRRWGVGVFLLSCLPLLGFLSTVSSSCAFF